MYAKPKVMKKIFIFSLNLLILSLIAYFFIKYSVNNAIFDFNCRNNRQIILKSKEINFDNSKKANLEYANNISNRLQEFGINDYKISLIGDDKIKLNIAADDEDQTYIDRLLLENCNFSLSNNGENEKKILINKKLGENAYVNVSSDYHNVSLIIPFSKNYCNDVKELFIQAKKNANSNSNNNISFKDLNKNIEISNLNANDLYYKNKENSLQINFNLQFDEEKIKSTYKKVFFYKTLLNSKNFQNKFEIISSSFIPAINKKIFNYNDYITESNIFFFMLFLILAVGFLLIKIYKIRALMIIINVLMHTILSTFFFVFLKRTLNIYFFVGILIIFMQSLIINILYNNFFSNLESEKIDTSLIKKIFLNANKKLILFVYETSLFSFLFGICFYFLATKTISNFGVILSINAFTNFLTNYVFIKKHMSFFIKKEFLFKRGNFIKKINSINNNFVFLQNEKKNLKYLKIILGVIVALNLSYQILNRIISSNKYEISFVLPKNCIESDKIKYNFQEILENIPELKYDKNSIYIYSNKQDDCFNFNVIDFKHFDNYSLKYIIRSWKKGKIETEKEKNYINNLSKIIIRALEARYANIYAYNKVNVNVRKVNDFNTLNFEKIIFSTLILIILLFAFLLIIKKKKMLNALKICFISLIIKTIIIISNLACYYEVIMLSIGTSFFFNFIFLNYYSSYDKNSTYNFSNLRNILDISIVLLSYLVVFFLLSALIMDITPFSICLINLTSLIYISISFSKIKINHNFAKCKFPKIKLLKKFKDNEIEEIFFENDNIY